MAQAADAVTLLAAALFVGTVVTWLAYAASRSSDAFEDDHRHGAAELQLSRAVPVVVTGLFVVAVVAVVVLSALVPAAA